MKPTYILGIHTGHNGTAALLQNGAVIACASEERFVGTKNYLGYPARAVEWVLQYAGLTPQRLDRVALVGSFGAPIFAAPEAQRGSWLMRGLVVLYRLAGWVSRGYGWLAYRQPFLRRAGLWCYNLAVDLTSPIVVRHERQAVAQRLGVPVDRVVLHEHHACHAATAAYASPYNHEDQLVLTLDGEGDKLCGTVNVFRGGTLTRIAATPLGHSIGWVYMELTRYLGMKPGEHEYKVMGLAPYAKPERVDRLYQRIKGLVTLDPRNPLRHWASIDTHQTYRYMQNTLQGHRFDEVAGAFQRLLEELVTAWAREAVRATGIRTVTVGGGVFMNVKANQRIAELPEVERFFATPTCGDESNAIGTAYLAYLAACRQQGCRASVPPFDILYWGPEFSDETIGACLQTDGLGERYRVEQSANIEERVAELLAQGQVVARVAGRMEWGARALGNRSILAHPSDPETVRVINESIKKRDFWMPFTPSIAAERAGDYVVNPKRIPARFMAITFDSTSRARHELKAAMHPYDFTIRPQLVDPAMNPSYYRLIKGFEHRTGIGAVLNTSFNLHGQPVVLGPREALRAFAESGLVHLALGPFLISKRGEAVSQPMAAEALAHG